MNARFCENCTYALALFDENEPDKKSKEKMVCQHNRDGGRDIRIVNTKDICAAHLFRGTAEAREGHR